MQRNDGIRKSVTMPVSNELIHGELLVTPAPAPAHETILTRLMYLLIPYVAAHNLGWVVHPRQSSSWNAHHARFDAGTIRSSCRFACRSCFNRPSWDAA